MKRDDAVKILTSWRDNGCEGLTDESLGYIEMWFSLTDKEAFDMAIHALETSEVYMTAKDYDLYLEGYKAAMQDYKKIRLENEQLTKQLETYKKSLFALQDEIFGRMKEENDGEERI